MKKVSITPHWTAHCSVMKRPSYFLRCFSSPRWLIHCILSILKKLTAGATYSFLVLQTAERLEYHLGNRSPFLLVIQTRTRWIIHVDSVPIYYFFLIDLTYSLFLKECDHSIWKQYADLRKFGRLKAICRDRGHSLEIPFVLNHDHHLVISRSETLFDILEFVNFVRGNRISQRRFAFHLSPGRHRLFPCHQGFAPL